MATAVKRTLALADLDTVIVEIERLRDGGYAQAGQWSLERMCFHLGRPIPRPLTAFPAEPAPVVIQSTLERLRHYAEHDAPSPGITAPPGAEPPDDVPAGAVADLIGRLREVIAFDAAYVDFGARGPVPTDLYKQFIRGHCTHHLSFLVPNGRPPRTTPLRFASTRDVRHEIERLRRGYTATGRWSLAQVCYHCDRSMRQAMTPGPHPANTAEQDARRPLFEQILATNKIPDGLVAPDSSAPPAHVPDVAVDECLATLDRFDAYAGEFAPHRLFGNVAREERRRHQLVHCAHHLAFLVPAEPATT